LGPRRRAVATTATLVALLVVGAAVAAFILYTGATGTGSAHVSGSSTLNALSLTENGSPELAPGSQVTTAFHLINNDPAASHRLDQLTGTITTSPSNCADFITWSSNGGPLVGSTVPAGSAIDADGGFYNVQSAIPAACANATVTLALTGTTTP